MGRRRSESQPLIWLALLLFFSAALVFFRLHHTHTPYYRFLLWNLILALLPLGFAHLTVWLAQAKKSRYRSSLCFVLWLLFFPNAPYILTDLMHLGYLQQMPRWYDPLMVSASALTGLFASFLSLREVEKLWKTWTHRCFKESGLLLIWFLSSIGIYLGRVLRWNSWDVFHQPLAVFKDLWAPFLHPAAFPKSLALILLYTLFLRLLYGIWSSAHSSPEDA